MTDDRLTEILDNWRRYNRRPNINLGWPPKSIGFECDDGSWDGYGWDDDRATMPQSDTYAVIDDNEARAVQVIIDDLPGKERDSVYNVVMETKRPLGEPLQAVYMRAREMLVVVFARRGIY